MTAPVWKSTTMALRAVVSKLGRCAAAGAAAATPAARSAPVRKRESTRLFMRPLSIRCVLGGAIGRDLQHAPGLRRNCDGRAASIDDDARSEEHTSELQSHVNLVCRLLLEKKKNKMK